MNTNYRFYQTKTGREGPHPHPAVEDLPEELVMRAMAVRIAHNALRQVEAR